MLIDDALKKQNMTKYRLSKESGVPQATINDICSGKSDIEKCSAGTLYKIAKVLHVTVEDILENAKEEYRSSFETFKSNTCHLVKDMGDLNFIVEVLDSNRVQVLYDKKWFPEAFYLLAMLDYLSRENDIPICTKYNRIRLQKLEKPIYPTGVLLESEILKSDAPIKQAEKDAIPEFRRFNIIECDIRNII